MSGQSRWQREHEEHAMLTGGTVERAFELARSGECSTMRDLEVQLRRELYENVQEHLRSPSLRAQLIPLMESRALLRA
jgi:hypothetical protein